MNGNMGTIIIDSNNGGGAIGQHTGIEEKPSPISLAANNPHVNQIERNASYAKNLYLYSEEDSGILLPNVLHSLANYSSVIPAASTGNLAEEGGATASAPPPAKANMGTFVGVFLPCIQNIFGVILFIRLTWVVGTAGSIVGFGIVLMCCCVTMLTAISMSAIATNGVVPGGGSYFMISRSLGPEFGGAVGILFYIGTTLAAAMYIVGAVEILLNYIAPGISLFGDINNPENMYNNYRVYGSCLLVVIGCIVYIGVVFVNKFAGVALACVIMSITAVYVGIFVNVNGSDKLYMCTLGTRLIQITSDCSKNTSSELHRMYCGGGSSIMENGGAMENGGSFNHDMMYDSGGGSDSDCDEYYKKNELRLVKGIKGLASGVFYTNMKSSFIEKGMFFLNGQIVNYKYTDYEVNPTVKRLMNGTEIKENYNQVIVDITTSFTILVGIFFPSVTGIMAGSNRSGDLADAQKSIPIGTIGAIITTSTVYLSSVLLFSGTVDNLLLRDKFGQSIGGRLVVANIAWPNEWVILIGSLLSTIGAGLQSLTGAPRLLQAIARDNIIPFLKPFQVSSSRGEPTKALLVTLCICQCGVLLGNVDYLAPLLSMFFLMCYGFVNLACAVQTLLKTPNWRPRFKFYHWTLSFVGVFLCITVMFMTSWYYALLAMGIAGLIYKYIEYRGAEKEWGDGIRGLALSAARFSLLRLEEAPPHTKNWRPQILILTKINPATGDIGTSEKKLFTLASQLKAGKGLIISGSVVDTNTEIGGLKSYLNRILNEEKVKGFVHTLSFPHLNEGLDAMIQTSGLGGLKPNTVLLGWPMNWKNTLNKKPTSNTLNFLNLLRLINYNKMAVLIPKGIAFYPDSGDRISGNIDIWWIIHDGGLLMLLPFLLKQHRTWRNCKLRIFTIAQIEDNSIQMKNDLTAFLYALRIDCEVEVVEMMNSDISAYTYERTLMMEQRNQILKELNLTKKRRKSMVEELINPNLVEMSDQQEQDTIRLISGGSTNEIQIVGSGGGGGGGTTGTSKVRFQVQQYESQFSSGQNNGVDTPPKLPTQSTLEEESSEEEEEEESNQTLSDTKPVQETAPNINVSKTSLNSEMMGGDGGTKKLMGDIKPDEENVRRMHTAVKLNEVIQNKSIDSKLVIINLPSPPKRSNYESDSNYMEFLEVLTEGMDRVLMVRGSGREVITIYS